MRGEISSEMNESIDKLVKSFTDYRFTFMGNYMSDNTNKKGQTLLLLSAILILFFRKIININGGDFLGLFLELDQGKEYQFYSLIVVFLTLLCFQYLLNFLTEYKIWQLKVSQSQEKMNSCAKTFENNFENSRNQFIEAVAKNDLLNLEKSVNEMKVARDFDKIIIFYVGAIKKETRYIFLGRIITDFAPIVMYVVCILFAFKH